VFFCYFPRRSLQRSHFVYDWSFIFPGLTTLYKNLWTRKWPAPFKCPQLFYHTWKFLTGTNDDRGEDLASIPPSAILAAPIRDDPPKRLYQLLLYISAWGCWEDAQKIGWNSGLLEYYASMQ
jgi:hypothetical protein